jgi:hypothetical protein
MSMRDVYVFGHWNEYAGAATLLARIDIPGISVDKNYII